MSEATQLIKWFQGEIDPNRTLAQLIKDAAVAHPENQTAVMLARRPAEQWQAPAGDADAHRLVGSLLESFRSGVALRFH